MAGLIKEMMLDYGMNRLSSDQRIDILTAIQSLYRAGVLSIYNLKLLDMYISGYTADEIATQMYDLSISELVEQELQRIMTAIETASGYTDVGLVRKLESQQYPKSKIHTFSIFLTQHSKDYTTHTL